MKKYAIIVNTEDYTNIEICKGNREEGLARFKSEVEDNVNSQMTTGVGFVELEEDGTGEIYIDYDITGPGESYTFDPESNFWDEDEVTFDEFFENWFNEQQ